MMITDEQYAARKMAEATQAIAAAMHGYADRVAKSIPTTLAPGTNYSDNAARVVQEVMGMLPNLELSALIRNAAAADEIRRESAAQANEAS